MGESRNSDVCVGHFDSTCIPEEEAVQKCYVQKVKTFVITSFITSEVMKPDVHEFGCFFHPEVIADMCGSSVTTLRNFIFVVVLGPPVCMLYLLTMPLLPLMGHNWLFFLVMSLVIHITVRIVIEVLASESGSNINSTVLFWYCHPFITE